MSDKKVNDAMDQLFGKLTTPSPAQEPKAPAKPKDGKESSTTSSPAKQKAPDERVCTIVRSDLMAKVRYIVGKESIAIRDVFEAALTLAVNEYERRYGEIKPRPKRKRGDIGIFFDDDK